MGRSISPFSPPAPPPRSTQTHTLSLSSLHLLLSPPLPPWLSLSLSLAPVSLNLLQVAAVPAQARVFYHVRAQRGRPLSSRGLPLSGSQRLSL